MSNKLVIDPVTRIEGHLKVEVEIEDAVVKDCRASGMLYRGIEQILLGRDPRDANQITQRICGVCPIAHATASTMCLDSAFGITDKIPPNAWLVRNIIHATNHIHNAVLHFYHLSLLDYIDIARVRKGISAELDLVSDFLTRQEKGPFMPREEDFRLPDEVNQRMVQNYLKALEIRRIAQEALAIFGGKMPHQCGTIPGGVTQAVDAGKIESYLGKIKEVKEFIYFSYWQDIVDLTKYYPEYWSVGPGCKNLLSYGIFPEKTEQGWVRFQPAGVLAAEKQEPEELKVEDITEDVKHSWYEGARYNPAEKFPLPDYSKPEGYSWLKSPRYQGKVYEVGPLARVLLGYKWARETWRHELDMALTTLQININSLYSVLGRHLCRAIESRVLVREVEKWLLSIEPNQPFYTEYEIPLESAGAGLTEGARGAVGHWIKIKDKKIAHYQVISPTTWNASPRDEQGNPGPLEQAIMGTKIKDQNNPVEVTRIIRSFDPCLACAVQIVNHKHLKGKKVYPCL